MKNYNFIALGAVILLQGCATNLVPKDINSIENKIPLQFYIEDKNENSPNILEVWKKFNNPELTNLIKTAQENSSDISKARVSLKTYEAQVLSSRARNIPSLSAIGNASRTSTQVSNTSNVGAGLQTSWELDLFGINELNTKSQNQQVLGAKAQLYQAHIVVAAEVARSYFNYGYCLKTVDVLQKDYDSRSIQNNLTKANVQYGVDSGSSLFLSEAALAQTQANIVEQKSKCETEIKGLVALTGESEPDLRAKLSQSQSIDDTALVSPPSIPASLIEKRPDIYTAYRNVEAKALAVGVARGKRYPSISFSGNILASSVSTGGINISGNTWSIGPLSVSFPIFDGGAIKANEELALETYYSSQKEFLSIFRTAIKEIETAYITLNAAQEKYLLNQISISGYEKSLEASTARYRGGISNLYELEDSRRSYFNALANEITIQNTRTSAWIDLYKAMGGEFTR